MLLMFHVGIYTNVFVLLFDCLAIITIFKTSRRFSNFNFIHSEHRFDCEFNCYGSTEAA